MDFLDRLPNDALMLTLILQERYLTARCVIARKIARQRGNQLQREIIRRALAGL
jgi:hypothetical protein